jgi:hypothetical protein
MIGMIGGVALMGCDERPRHEPHAVEGPQRIVSLAPAITETLFALGAGAEVAGVSQYCDYPPEVTKLPKVGTFLTPNIEAIAGRRPTIVIGLRTSSDLREIRALQAMGYRTLMVDDNSIAGIEASILTVGDAIGRAREARVLLDRTHMKIEAIEERLRGVPPGLTSTNYLHWHARRISRPARRKPGRGSASNTLSRLGPKSFWTGRWARTRDRRRVSGRSTRPSRQCARIVWSAIPKTRRCIRDRASCRRSKYWRG